MVLEAHGRGGGGKPCCDSSRVMLVLLVRARQCLKHGSTFTYTSLRIAAFVMALLRMFGRDIRARGDAREDGIGRVKLFT